MAGKGRQRPFTTLSTQRPLSRLDPADQKAFFDSAHLNGRFRPERSFNQLEIRPRDGQLSATSGHSNLSMAEGLVSLATGSKE